ncbi:MAG: GH32 C-terminal domain-containing protein, partial [bacterium]|nr:GH32 C-terminal domain-containing protein [bacterium]
DTTYSSVSPDVRSRAPETAQFMLDEGEMLSLRIFIDKSVVEVFVNGKQCLATRVYPDRPDSVGISLRAQGQSAELRSVDLWQMKPIYGPASHSDR